MAPAAFSVTAVEDRASPVGASLMSVTAMLKSWLDDNLPGLVECIVKAEIERVLKDHPSIFNVQVVGIYDDRRGEIPAAFIELEPGAEPLTLDALQDVYRHLLKKYLGPQLEIDDGALLECLRIPHFYRAFYVYKYATGLSAAIALSERVLNGGQRELGDYLGFLQGGCSKYPLDLLRDAGVDMTKPEPVETALDRFAELVDELDELL